jgi:hypothetical protein
MTSMMMPGLFELSRHPLPGWADSDKIKCLVGPHACTPRLLIEFDRMSRAWVRKVRPVSLITVRSGGRGSRGADTWMARSALPFPLRSEWLGSTVIF